MSRVPHAVPELLPPLAVKRLTLFAEWTSISTDISALSE